ncbi:splicing factor U2af large subunit B-like [Pyrus x bretschneideri]|uniref:splicing factor U2af large subunit B-like n=1 Tax=Pyrus x bretschneideri TaxID=225117 RepID=UPI00202FB06A|nr:splicing factor U2af large subunit B-like [Pyrus x bretschneideri]
MGPGFKISRSIRPNSDRVQWYSHRQIGRACKPRASGFSEFPKLGFFSFEIRTATMSDYEGVSKNVRAREQIESETEVKIEKKMVTVIHESIRIEVEDLTEGGTRMMAISAVETKISTGIPQTMPGVVQNSLPFGALHMALPLMPAQAKTQQTIATFFSQVMAAIGGNSVGSISEIAGDAVVNVYINHEKKFAFVEMRTVEEAREGVNGKVPAVGGAEGPDRIFVGGLPYYFTEARIRELLQSFGKLLKDMDSVFIRSLLKIWSTDVLELEDPTVTDIACGALNGLKMGDKTLTVRRATASNGQSKTEQENILVQAQQHIAMQKMAVQVVDLNLLGAGMATMASGETPTIVLCLTEVVDIYSILWSIVFKLKINKTRLRRSTTSGREDRKSHSVLS